jgi:hypothetical protein
LQHTAFTKEDEGDEADFYVPVGLRDSQKSDPLFAVTKRR